jgi:N-acetylglutamate synthase-like GNAT family acetyltransferase
MKQAITIRDAGPQDAEMIAGVIRRSFQDVAVRFSLTRDNCPKHPSNCTTAWVESDLERGVQYFILLHKGEPIGCVGLEKPGSDLCYLERLAVLPERRRHGFGRRLVDHALSQVKAGSVRRVSIGIIAEQTELKEWYANLGFVEKETKRFSHLPFRVTFMELKIDDTAGKALEAIS